MANEKLADKFLRSLILPGDILLYDKKGIGNTIIKFVRGEKYSHVAIASRAGKMMEARQWQRLDEVPIRTEGLAAIYRTKNQIDFEAGYHWFLTRAKGQKYDWIGLLSFKFAKLQGRNNGKMFCSEFAHRFFKKISYHLFAEDMDSDAVSPGMIPYSARVFPLWLRADKRKKS